MGSDPIFGNLSHNGEFPRAGLMARGARGASVPPKNDTEVTCESFTLLKNYWNCRATNT